MVILPTSASEFGQCSHLIIIEVTLLTFVCQTRIELSSDVSGENIVT